MTTKPKRETSPAPEAPSSPAAETRKVKIKMETSAVSDRFVLQQGREYDVAESIAKELVGNKTAVMVGTPPRPAARSNQQAKAVAVA